MDAVAGRARRRYRRAPAPTRWPRPSCGTRAPGSRRRTRWATCSSEAPLPRCGCGATSSPGGERVTSSQATRLRTNDIEYRLVATEWTASAGIGRPVEVVRGVDGARHALLTSIERLPAGTQPDQAGVELVLFVQVRRQAVSVAERAVNDAVRPPVRRFQIVTMEVVSQAQHATENLSSSVGSVTFLMAMA